MDRAERRHHAERIKAKFRRLTRAMGFGQPDDPRWLGMVATQHFTCPCGMCTSALKHRHPEPSPDPELEQDWVYERYVAAKEARLDAYLENLDFQHELDTGKPYAPTPTEEPQP